MCVLAFSFIRDTIIVSAAGKVNPVERSAALLSNSSAIRHREVNHCNVLSGHIVQRTHFCAILRDLQVLYIRVTVRQNAERQHC